jgi:hypothetical protein
LTDADIKPIPIGDPAPIASAVAASGSTPGTTKIIATPFGSGNHIAIKLAYNTLGAVPNVGDPLPTGATLINPYSGNDIEGMDMIDNKFIVVYEVDISNNIVAYKEIVLTVSDITSQASLPSLSANVAQGNTPGTTSVSATVGNPLNHLVVYGSDMAISAPTVGDSVPVASNVLLVDPYTSGTDIGNMDATVNKYLAVYETNNAGSILKYQLFTLGVADIKPTPVPALVVLMNQGSVIGTTKISSTSQIAAQNHLVVQISSAAVITPNVGDNVPTGIGVTDPYTVNADIAGVDTVTNKYVALYDADSSNKVVSFALITLTSADIKHLIPAPPLTATATPGTVAGTKVSATVGAGNHLVVQISSAFVQTPNVGVGEPVGIPGLTSPYTSGNDITGVDVATMKYVAVYESDSNWHVVSFTLFTLTAADINSNLAPPLASATAAAGTVEGSTSVTATIAGANHLVVKFSNGTILTPNTGEDAPVIAYPDWSVIDPYTQGSDITYVDDATNKYLGVYEVNSSNKVVSFKLITLIASEIKPYTSIPLMTASALMGSVVGTTAINAGLTMWSYFNHLTVKVSSVAIPTPNVGDFEPTGAGVINPYIYGDDITGVDATTNKYIAVYEANAAGLIVQFKLITLTAQDIKQITSEITAAPSTLSEAPANDGSISNNVITVTAINGGTFDSSIAKADVALSEINFGNPVSLYGYDFNVSYVDSTHIIVTLTGAASFHTAADSFNFAIKVLQSKVQGAVSDVTTNAIHVSFMD